MSRTVLDFLNEAKPFLNCMKPFIDMKSYDKITVTFKVSGLQAEIITHPWKAALGFDFYDYSLDNLQFKGVAIKDCIFVSCEIVDNGLIIISKIK